MVPNNGVKVFVSDGKSKSAIKKTKKKTVAAATTQQFLDDNSHCSKPKCTPLKQECYFCGYYNNRKGGRERERVKSRRRKDYNLVG